MIDDDFLEQILGQQKHFASPTPTAQGGVVMALSAKTLLRQWLDAKLDEIRAAESLEEAQRLIDALPPAIAKCIKVKTAD